jgi:hypothetical protein
MSRLVAEYGVPPVAGCADISLEQTNGVINAQVRRQTIIEESAEDADEPHKTVRLSSA